MSIEQIEDKIKSIKDIEQQFKECENKRKKLELEWTNLTKSLYDFKLNYYGKNFKYKIGDFVKVIDDRFEEIKNFIFQISFHKLEKYSGFNYEKHIHSYRLKEINNVYYDESVIDIIREFDFSENNLIEVNEKDIHELKKQILQKKIIEGQNEISLLQNEISSLQDELNILNNK